MRDTSSNSVIQTRLGGPYGFGLFMLVAAGPAAWSAFRLVAAVTCDADDCYGENTAAPLLVAAIVFGSMAVVGLVNVYDAVPEIRRPRFLIRAGWAGVIGAAPLAAGVVSVVSQRFCPSGTGCAGDYFVMALLALFAGIVVFLTVLSAGVVAIRKGRRARVRGAYERHPSRTDH